MLCKLVAIINSVDCFAVLADETADISLHEQLSIGVLYIHEDQIREDFLQFVPVCNVTGKGLAFAIMSSLGKIGIKTIFKGSRI
jgi:ABC-type uncharacterized transport system permease subunit